MLIMCLITYLIFKYDKTVDYVWETEDSLTTILRLMKAFREKGLTIFNKCCSLLSIFCQDPAKVEVSFLKTYVNILIIHGYIAIMFTG